ncbi:SDR family oxidoreductase [Amycolatopsis rhabdoformis]|uniref:SDR family oxidoreductase n=1 Tax=Amycolatopsis rhabdoformis TaxID=1448059 RepID=A0ABZ1HWU8_9PSEU|nr:SDR family oxidoreductase [Amycolatopsis rhabdoformis]WSE26319.1 SDR family oxidoreductase [Amycolatopsis rhabdoformis]
MDLGISGRVAVVTAASRGLGRASAIALAAEGVRLVVNARSADQLQRLRDEVDVDVEIVPGDVTDEALPQTLVDRALEKFGRLDIVVANNAGPKPGGAFEVSEEQLYGALTANTMSVIRLVRAARSALVEQGWGRLCLIASGSARQPMDNLALSNVARPALWGWAKTAANELTASGVTLNLVCPGAHATERIVELGRQDRTYIGDPDAFGKIVAFLCSAHTAYLTGAAVVVDGGRIQGL